MLGTGNLSFLLWASLEGGNLHGTAQLFLTQFFKVNDVVS